MSAQETVSNMTERTKGMVTSRQNRGARRLKQKCMSGMVTGLLALLSFPLGTGCQTGKTWAVNEAMLVSYRDMVWAKRAYNMRFGNCDRPYGEHYYNGFCAGYADICQGGDGYVPALPPSAYRTPRFQSPDGAQCVNAWFEGYPAGVAAAKQEKVGNFNNVLVSKMVDTAVATEKNVDRLLPSDVPVTKGVAPKLNETKPELSAPPAPPALSSILIPEAADASLDLPQAWEISTADLQPVGSPASSKTTPSLPPIVTGSGVVRAAELPQDGSTRSSSTRSGSEIPSRVIR